MRTLKPLDNKLHVIRKCGYCSKEFNNGTHPRQRYCSAECNHDAYVERKNHRKPIRRCQINGIADKLFTSKSLTEYTLHNLFASKHLSRYRASKIIPYFSGLFFLLLAAFNLFLTEPAFPDQTLTASWYSFGSCIKEGTSGIYTASGERFNENALTCAMPHRKFGKLYKVTNLVTHKSVIVRHNDFGPNKKLVKKGRVCDLSKAAFKRIASLSNGVIPISIQEVSK